MMYKKIKENKGITLIALVVTIIVLIILTGILINLLIDESGILNKTKEAKTMYDQESIKEALELEKVTVQLNNAGNVDLNSYIDQLNTGDKPFKINSIKRINEETAEVVVNDKYKFVLKDKKNGNIEILYEGEPSGLTLSEIQGKYMCGSTGTFEILNNESGGNLSVSSNDSEVATASINGNIVTVKAGHISGEATITVTSSANGKFGEEKIDYLAIVESGTITLSVTPYSGNYDGIEHNALTNVTVNPTDCKIEYKLNENEYTTTMPKVTGIDSYIITIKASKTDYMTETVTETVSVGYADASSFTVSLPYNSTPYTGNEITPETTVKQGSITLTLNTDYTVSYVNNTNVGTATVTISGKGNYTGTKTINFDIEKARQNFELTASNYNTIGIASLSGDIVIPGTYDNGNVIYTVTSIAKNAFHATQVTSVTIPETVTSIGNNAFWECTELTTVNNLSKITQINNNLFHSCPKLKSVTIPNSVTSIGEYAFYNCTSLTSITIPNSVTSIGEYAFYKCTSLTSITIPDSVTSLGEKYAFYNCTSVKSIKVGNGVKTIPFGCFENCTSCTSVTLGSNVQVLEEAALKNIAISSITLPNSLITVGIRAFEKDKNLTSITIPNKVTSIGYCAFWECSNLKTVVIGSSVSKISQCAFLDTALTSATFNTTSGWYIGDSEGTKTTSVNVSNTSNNATYLKSTYSWKYWTR